jgi:ring-1,2-phenylacetyl-CoA epoxidase subunit PaaE
MGLFSRSKKKEETVVHKRSAELTVSNHERLTAKAARISFEVPAEAAASFAFSPGQYLNLHCMINGSVLNRSYSICSAPGEPLSVAVKSVEGGVASNWLVDQLKTGSTIEVDFPHGNFGLQKGAKKHVAFAAGSGITPFLSMAKSVEGTDQEIQLFYGNSSQSETFFANELDGLSNTKTRYYFSREEVSGHQQGRFDKQTVSEIIKSDLSLLRAEAFYICGPEAMIVVVKEVLEVFGIKPEQIHFELFTTPVLMKAPETIVTGTFSGESTVSAILDGEIVTVKLNTKGKTVLEALDATGMDVPYSCKGGVCCTCKAKILEGSASMKINYALTDEEVAEGYLLTCQAHPTSEILKLDFDV